MPLNKPSQVFSTVSRLAEVGVRAALLLVLLALVAQDIHAFQVSRRGIESGLSPDQPPLMAPRWGINVALERYASAHEVVEAIAGLQDLGYGTLRQRLSWAEIEPAPGEFHWGRWDYILELARAEGFEIILVLDRAPAWARAPQEQENPYAPPQNPADYARFVAAVAERYRDHVLAYQIWDQPNIHPHWGLGPVDPAGYVKLLAAAAPAIRAADPQALIIAGGLAPNLETGGRNMSDVQFVHGIYRRGAGQWFDVLGVKAHGFWSGPYDRRVSPEVLNLSRVILLREEMVRRGDGHKPIWSLDGGWVALPEGWQGSPSPMGSDDPALQAGRLRLAMQRVQQEWPWMTLFTVLHLQPNAPPDDPIWGRSLLDADGQAMPLLLHLQALGLPEEAYYPGLHLEEAPNAASSEIALSRTLSLWGSDLTIWLDRNVADGDLQVRGARRALISLEGTSDALEQIWLVRNQPLDTLPLSLVGTQDQLAAVRAIQVGNRNIPVWLWLQSVVGMAACAWLAVGIWREGSALPWRQAWKFANRAWSLLPGLLQGVGLAALLLAALAAPHGMLRLALLACYSLGALFRPDIALLLVLALVPFAPVHVALGPGSFSVVEIAVLIAAAAHLGNALLSGSGLAKEGQGRRVVLLDILVLLYVLWSAASAGMAEYQRVAWREFRVVIAEPALLYALLRLADQDRRAWRQRLDVLFVSAAAVALYALAIYPTPAGVILAEGVRRARALYGSPNNLALYLGRFLPLGLAVALWGTGKARRWLYGLGAAAMAMAIALTFSRGAWLLGVPAGLLAIAWLRGGRARRAVLVGGLVGVVALVLVMRTPRMAALADPGQGTGFLRVQLWLSSWEMALDHPWLGIGPDNFLYYYGDYIRPGAEVDRWLSHPHNIVLDFWLRLGLPGLALLGAAAGAALVRAARALRSGKERVILIGLLGGVAAAGAHGLIDASWFVAELAYWGMFVLAWLASSAGQFDNEINHG